MSDFASGRIYGRLPEAGLAAEAAARRATNIAPEVQAQSARAVSGILTRHQSHRPFILASSVAACIAAATIWAMPLAARMLPPINSFVAMYAVMLFMVQSLTAYFLAVQFRLTREPFLGALSGAFGFVAVIILAQLLVYPDILGPRGLIPAGPQVSIWMWVEWQAGFPLIVCVGLLLHDQRLLPARNRLTDLAGRAAMAAGPASAALVAALTIRNANALPVLIANGSYAALQHSWETTLVVALTLAALVGCVRITRLQDLLSLWLAVALLAALCNAAMTLGGPTRFSLGWYGGRTLNLVSASLVFCVFIFEFSRLYERLVVTNAGLTGLAFYDGLTGAFNRGYFNEQFPREVKRAVREATELSVLMLDVDHFKSYNDQHGHQKGDQCLVALVHAIQDIVVRPGDFAARYGGEEFVVVLPRTPCEAAHQLALKIREKVASLQLERQDMPGRVVTVSVGVATLGPDTIAYGADELVRRADKALYEAKRAGRDTARIFSAEAA